VHLPKRVSLFSLFFPEIYSGGRWVLAEILECGQQQAAK